MLIYGSIDTCSFVYQIYSENVIKFACRSNEEVLSVIREGNMAAITLNQVTILKEQAPNDKDV